MSTPPTRPADRDYGRIAYEAMDPDMHGVNAWRDEWPYVTQALVPSGHRVVRETEWTAVRERAERLRLVAADEASFDALCAGDLADDL